MPDQLVRASVIAAYFLIVLGIGVAAYRRTGTGTEEYFLGGRSAKTLVLFMALFGTNVTPFVLMGIPGLSYHGGIGVFGLNAAIIVLGIPLTIYLIGFPAWKAAKRLGAMTPAELYAKRFGSPVLGILLFVVFFVWTVAYMVTSVSGVGVAVEILSDGAMSFELAAAGILILTLAYTSAGGMRATMWTNVFQGSVFLLFTLVAFFWVAGDHGGFTALADRVRINDPHLLTTPGPETPGPFAPGAWMSWGLGISLTVIAFPHMLVRLFAAEDSTALKNACRFYPLAMILLWVPAVMFGIWGTVEFPELVGKASDEVFPRLVLAHMGPALQGLALAAILAAVMSTLDAQMLTLSSMLGRDVIRVRRPDMGEDKEVRYGRIFLVVLALLTFGISITKPDSIFAMAKLSFSGYCTVVPTLLLGMRWRRFTRQGAIASVVAGNVFMLGGVFELYPMMGLLPIAWGLIAAIVFGVGLSLMTPATDEALDRAAFG